MSTRFLTAEWRKIIMINYEIDPELLQSYIPAGTVLDTWNNICLISLVGFRFCNTRLKGIRIPFHVNFEEVNLRIYVRREGPDAPVKRGVVFIKEIVPRYAISFVANTVYKENYQTMPMDHHWESSGDQLNIQYRWKYRRKWNNIGVNALNKPGSIQPDSEEAFITEHYFGYARVHDQLTHEYEVEHPVWQIYPVRNYRMDVEFGSLYGSHLAGLGQIKPRSVLLAEGSKVTIKAVRKIKTLGSHRAGS